MRVIAHTDTSHSGWEGSLSYLPPISQSKLQQYLTVLIYTATGKA